MAAEDPAAGLEHVDELARLLRAENRWARANAALALAAVARADPDAVADAVPALSELLDDDSEAVRANALEAVGAVAGARPALVEEAAPAVAGVLDADDADVRRTATRVLALVAEESADAVEPVSRNLETVLSDERTATRADATFTLERVADASPASVSPVAGRLERRLSMDDDETVRSNAAKALLHVKADQPGAVERSLSELRAETAGGSLPPSVGDVARSAAGRCRAAAGRTAALGRRAAARGVGVAIDGVRDAVSGVRAVPGRVHQTIADRPGDGDGGDGSPTDAHGGSGTETGSDDGTGPSVSGLVDRAAAARRRGDEARREGDYETAAERYAAAVETYRSASEQVSSDERREEIESALESVVVDRRRAVGRREERSDLRATLAAAEQDLAVASREHVDGNETVARIRSRQARDRYSNALDRLDDGSLHHPVAVPTGVDSAGGEDAEPVALRPDKRTVTGLDERTADRLESAGFDTASEVRAASVDELVEVEEVDEPLATRVIAWAWLPTDGTRRFETVEDIQQRRYVASREFERCR